MAATDEEALLWQSKLRINKAKISAIAVSSISVVVKQCYQ